MSDRKRLIELIRKVDNMRLMRKGFAECADYLLANGVIVPPCNVGDMVYVSFSTFYAEYTVSKFICDGCFIWAKLVNNEYEPPNREILRCISFDLNKTIFLDAKEVKQAIKEREEK